MTKTKILSLTAAAMLALTGAAFAQGSSGPGNGSGSMQGGANANSQAGSTMNSGNASDMAGKKNSGTASGSMTGPGTTGSGAMKSNSDPKKTGSQSQKPASSQ